ncbi:hypothetical protein DICVIV_12525 [Dictyocaulus viviparus]|uniref:Uncharacterized protein n=1 Tax=Dictyocaulus viviparus TaxID=29172 RepID=A0A0D8XGJ5_DICVI|nr:hypothetical protein DICVIV_12525 [Dictyocaulus viviparus]
MLIIKVPTCLGVGYCGSKQIIVFLNSSQSNMTFRNDIEKIEPSNITSYCRGSSRRPQNNLMKKLMSGSSLKPSRFAME